MTTVEIIFLLGEISYPYSMEGGKSPEKGGSIGNFADVSNPRPAIVLCSLLFESEGGARTPRL